MKYILSIDQSTSGTKGLIFDADGALLARADLPHRQITNSAGWVEHDADEILKNTLDVAAQALQKSGVDPADVCAAGISNQRETGVLWSKKSGAPLCNAIVWQCARAAGIARQLEAEGAAARIRAITGLTLSPYFTAPKLRWAVENIPAVRAALERDNLCAGTVDSFLVSHLTQEHAFKTDFSNASRTMLLDLDRGCWSGELTALFGLRQSALPELCASDDVFGHTTFGGLLPHPVPLCGVLGDSHGALFANRCLAPGEAKVTYGTGSSIMMNAGPQRPKAVPGIVTSIAWKRQGQMVYALEGNINYTGAVTKWLVEDLGLLAHSRDAGEIAAAVPSTEGVYLVPAFSGLGAPYFDDDARAILCGMNRTTRKAHVVRAAEECIAYQIADVVAAMDGGGRHPASLCADGGPTHDRFLMQFQADILGIPLEISRLEELSGAGAAYCAAIACGASDEKRIFAHREVQQIDPQMTREQREKLRRGWQQAVSLILKK